jgi:hypothetical protein
MRTQNTINTAIPARLFDARSPRDFVFWLFLFPPGGEEEETGVGGSGVVFIGLIEEHYNKSLQF